MAIIVPGSQWATGIKDLCEYTCQYCGSTQAIEAHHMRPKSISPELENDLENGIALCHSCHLKAHGGRYARHLSPMKYKKADCEPVQEFVQRSISLLVPKGQKATIEAFAEKQGESINGITTKALLAFMGLSEWPPLQEEEASTE